MKNNVQEVIFAEHNEGERFSLSASTDSEGLNLTLTLRDTHSETKTITMTDSEFNRLAESLGYKRQVYNSMDEVLNDNEFYLVDDGIN